MEIEEGEEPEVFWIALGGREEYGSLLDGNFFVFYLFQNVRIFENSRGC